MLKGSLRASVCDNDRDSKKNKGGENTSHKVLMELDFYNSLILNLTLS